MATVADVIAYLPNSSTPTTPCGCCRQAASTKTQQEKDN